MNPDNYFKTMREDAERYWGSLARPHHGTIGRISQAQTIGSIIPSAQTWDAYAHINRPPQEVTVEQVFFEPPKPAQFEGVPVQQIFFDAPPALEFDADGDAIMRDEQNNRVT